MSVYLLKPEASPGRLKLPPLCVMLPLPSFLKRCLSCSAIEKSSPFDSSSIAIFRNGSRLLVGPFSGAPAAALLMERLIPRGVKKFVLLGTCGSLEYGVKTGDIFIPSHGVSEEGTSSLYGYGERVPPPDAGLRNSLKDAFGAGPSRVHSGGVWSTDAPYMETAKKVAYYRGRGVSVVDMESTALFSVASTRSVSVAAVFVVSDRLLSGKWQPGFYDNGFKKGVRHAIEVTSSFAASE